MKSYIRLTLNGVKRVKNIKVGLSPMAAKQLEEEVATAIENAELNQISLNALIKGVDDSTQT
jgi:hypothetical protein